jgi:queuine tRNA-ribosyltransferase
MIKWYNKPMLTDKSIFSYQKTAEFSRAGVLKTRAGDVHTPVFMPVGTRGAVKSLTPAQVAAAGSQIILGNTYHLHLQPGEEVVAALGGLHQFTRWSGPILTDSGGFQVFSLAHARKITEEGVTFKDPKTGDTVFISPEISVQIQLKLGSDIIMAFDDLTGLDETARLRQKEAVERTHRWLERSVLEFQRLTKNLIRAKRPLLFGIVQGGLSESLRKQSLDYVQDLPVDGIAIGGLSVGETRAEMHAMLDFLAPHYDADRPHYLMGVGDPVDFRYAIERGVDMMDCVMATRNARHATAWIEGDKKIHLTNAKYTDDPSPIEPGCDCATCAGGFSRGFLRHQFKVGESLAGSLTSIHNIRYLHRISEIYRALATTE